ncbi:DUF1778 domain-containing protein, partial [Salmonella enterica subsp. enterica serovar Cerro]|nr:DUF1778 domain-containing protein [Salmonella enterica subsp. enterica serovar Cerro]
LDNQRLRILSEYEWEHLNYVLNNPRPAGDKLRKLMTRKTKYEKQY